MKAFSVFVTMIAAELEYIEATFLLVSNIPRMHLLIDYVLEHSSATRVSTIPSHVRPRKSPKRTNKCTMAVTLTALLFAVHSDGDLVDFMDTFQLQRRNSFFTKVIPTRLSIGLATSHRVYNVIPTNMRMQWVSLRIIDTTSCKS